MIIVFTTAGCGFVQSFMYKQIDLTRANKIVMNEKMFQRKTMIPTKSRITEFS